MFLSNETSKCNFVIKSGEDTEASLSEALVMLAWAGLTCPAFISLSQSVKHMGLLEEDQNE